MKANSVLALLCVALLGVAGCNKAASPAKVDNDVAKAADSAGAQDEKAAQKQAETDASVNKDVARAEDKADTRTASAAADTALTQAEGDNKVALAKCEALQGDARKACKDQADAALDMAKARAKAMKADRG
jgi:hypothetical protein